MDSPELDYRRYQGLRTAQRVVLVDEEHVGLLHQLSHIGNVITYVLLDKLIRVFVGEDVVESLHAVVTQPVGQPLLELHLVRIGHEK